MKRGFAKIEFFANLEYLKQEYNKGYVVSKYFMKKQSKIKIYQWFIHNLINTSMKFLKIK